MNQLISNLHSSHFMVGLPSTLIHTLLVVELPALDLKIISAKINHTLGTHLAFFRVSVTPSLSTIH